MHSCRVRACRSSTASCIGDSFFIDVSVAPIQHTVVALVIAGKRN
jgi:hypothetical protein